MTARIIGSRPGIGLRRGVLVLAGATAMGSMLACERALLVAPSDSTLTLSAASLTMPVSATAEITVTLTDTAGKPVANGTTVNVQTSMGTIEPAEAQTTNGRATARLTSGRISGIAAITASSGGVQSNVLEIRIGSLPGRIGLTATPTTPTTTLIVASVFDVSGVSVPGASVTFTSTAGILATSVVLTDGLGQASNMLFSATDAVVTAESGGVRANVAARVTGATGLSVNLGISPANPLRRQLITFTATVSGVGGAASPILRYEWEFGDGIVTTTGNITTRAYEVEGIYSVTVRVFGVDGSVGISRIEYYVA